MSTLNKYLPHLSDVAKNRFIEDLVNSNPELALEAIHEFTHESDLNAKNNIATYFYSAFEREIAQGKPNILKIRLALDNIIVNAFEKMIEFNQTEELINNNMQTILPLNEKSFNQLIELTNLLEKKEQTSYLKKLMDLSQVRTSFYLTPQSQKILAKNLDQLTPEVMISVLANTDLLNYHQLEKDFIKNNESNTCFGHYMYDTHQKTGFRIALVLDLLTNRIENQALIDHIKACSTEKECIQIARVIEKNEDGISLTHQVEKIKAIQKVIPFSQAKVFLNVIETRDFLMDFKDYKEILDFIFEDPLLNVKTINIIRKDDLLDYFSYLIDDKLFDNVHDVCNLLRCSYLIKENIDDSAIVQIFFNWLDKNKEEILSNLNSYNDDEYPDDTIDNIKIKLENQILDSNMTSLDKQEKVKSKKMKL